MVNKSVELVEPVGEINVNSSEADKVHDLVGRPAHDEPTANQH